MTSTRKPSSPLRWATATGPLLLSLALAWLVTGPVSLGGGEKDILLVIPLVLWSFLYLCGCLVFWWRGVSLGRSVAGSAGMATGLIVLTMVALYFVLQPRSAQASQPGTHQALHGPDRHSRV